MNPTVSTPTTASVPNPAPVSMEPQQDRASVPANRIPSNWMITPGEQPDTIEAINNATTASFKGTVEEFNKKYLRA